MSIAAETLTKAEREQHEWQEWQKKQADKRRKLGYDKPVSDEEALDVLG